ncbi:hypothetical protein GY26_16870 [Gammaproteobacteria bacterium MFB021]|nr:hypothetical protein GY26_16870 [Gammaproteobacteria bacterium MFB021]
MSESAALSMAIPDDQHRHWCLTARGQNPLLDTVKEAGIQLPKGQRTHVLRHTFASHFMMNGGDVLTLQKILGHQTITMTMRYAHLSPDHLADAIKYAPKIG